MTEDRNPESQRDLALRLISRRRPDPTAFRPPSGGMNPLQALEWVGKQAVRDPLSAAMSYASLSEADHRRQREGAPWWQRALSAVKEPVDWFNVDRWGEARGTRGSLGQSVLTGLLTSDVRDPAEVARARESQLYRKGSGVVDLAARLTVDPAAVLGGQTFRALAANAARKGGPAAAAGIRSAAAGNRFGLRDPGRWIGDVDPPDARPSVQTTTSPSGLKITSTDIHPGGSAGHVHGGAHQFDTPRYLGEIRAARPEVLTARVPETVASSLRRDRSNHWRGAVVGRSPILEDGYIVPVGPGGTPAHGVLVQIDEAGQIVGKPRRAVGDTTRLQDYNFAGRQGGSGEPTHGWLWIHSGGSGRVTPAESVLGPAVNRTGVYKVAMTGEEVASSTVDDLLERFDRILPDEEWDTIQVPRVMEGGVFKGTAAEGKTLTEIGEMVRNGQELRFARGSRWESYTPDEIRHFEQNSLSREEADAIWPTVARMYADEAVDNILTARDDMDTMRLRALFYDDPSMAGEQTTVGAIQDFVNRGARQGQEVGGLEDWAEVVQSSETQLAGFGQIRDLIVADLRAITRKFADDVDMPERVSVGRWQAPGEPIGASGSTWPMDPQWAEDVTTGHFRRMTPSEEAFNLRRGGTGTEPVMSTRYGRRGPGGMGGTTGHKWIEAVVDPRKDIDFFMLSRTGHNFAEHEMLMSPAKWVEKAVAGLGDAVGGVAPASMPGLTSAQIEFGENAPRWIQRVVDELEAAGAEPDLLKSYLTAPAGRTREALANRVRAEINVGRRNMLEADGWGNLPTPGAIRTPSLSHKAQKVLNQTSTIHDEPDHLMQQIASGQYDQADWFRFGTHQNLPTPPNFNEFMTQLSQEMAERAGRAPLSDMPKPGAVNIEWDHLHRAPVGAMKSFKEWVNAGDPNATAQSLSGIVGWTVREGVTDPRASMELLPGWQHQLKRLVEDWYTKPAGREFRLKA